MRTIKHRQSSLRLIMLASILMAVALPVTVLFSREDPSVDTDDVFVAVPVPVPQSSGVWPGDMTQSASMVLVGGLLIGIGAAVRRTV